MYSTEARKLLLPGHFTVEAILLAAQIGVHVAKAKLAAELDLPLKRLGVPLQISAHGMGIGTGDAHVHVKAQRVRIRFDLTQLTGVQRGADSSACRTALLRGRAL